MQGFKLPGIEVIIVPAGICLIIGFLLGWLL